MYAVEELAEWVLVRCKTSPITLSPVPAYAIDELAKWVLVRCELVP